MQEQLSWPKSGVTIPSNKIMYLIVAIIIEQPKAKKYNTILLEIMHNNIDKGSRRKDTDSTWKNYE
jgi:hypothetical protein